VLTFVVRFQTAQFKTHFQKLVRKTYLIPPPSAVVGLFCAILGISRNKLKNFCKEKNILAGAELRSLEGYYTTFSRIFKLDRNYKDIIELLNEWSSHKPTGKRQLRDVYKDIAGLTPIKESEELFKPEYKFAIAANNEIVKEGLRRIRELDFEYDIFGGNDYHFVEYIGDAREAHLIKSREGSGYCPTEDVQRIKAQNYTIITDAKYSLRNGGLRPPIVIFAPIGPKMKTFAFVHGASIITTLKKDAVYDGESTIFVYDPTRCLVP